MSNQDRGPDPGADEGAARRRKSPTPMGPPGPEPPPILTPPLVLYVTPYMPSPETTVPSVEAEQVQIEEGSPPPLDDLLSQGIVSSEPDEE